MTKHKLGLVVLLLVVLAPARALADDGQGMPDYVLKFLLDLLQPVVLAIAGYVGIVVTAWIREHVQNVALRNALERAENAIGAAVGEVAQTFVDGLKKASEDGILTPDEAKKALQAALGKARANLGPKGVSKLREVLGKDEGALDAWLVSQIEAEVARRRRNLPSEPQVR